MPHRNETMLRDLYAASAGGDVQRIRQLMHPDIVWHVPGHNILAGEYKGIDEVLGLFGRLAS
ncbi:nuclear transport factor 2 family protein [Geodermatophilus maliterrae]|uniref:Nuclear transport factor 2 family protein n=1 Tax=Geodermatophilus maliterrae TaxID=3162531 RepID=A0ABV3XFD6_9ACTN